VKKGTAPHSVIDDDAKTRDLIAQLTNAEAAIKEFLGEQIDAVLDPIRSTPVLLRQAQEALLEEMRLRKLAAILQNVQDCIIVTDPEGTITYWNEGAVALFGYPNEEAAGQSLALIYPYQDPQALNSDLEMILSGADIREERRFRHRDGGCVWADVRMTPKTGLEGTAAGFILVAKDSTERKKAADLLKRSESKLKQLSRRLVSAQEDERKRVSMELHDSVAASLSAIKFRLEKELENLPESRERTQLEAAVTLIQQLNNDVRRIMADLRPSVLDDLGLKPALNAHCREFSRHYPEIAVELTFAAAEDEVPEELKIVVFRIVQEALSNIGKYSRAKALEIVVEKEGRALELRVHDDGVGFDPKDVNNHSNPGEGMGLENMAERARLAGGALRVVSNPGRGTTIRAVWRIDRLTAS